MISHSKDARNTPHKIADTSYRRNANLYSSIMGKATKQSIFGSTQAASTQRPIRTARISTHGDKHRAKHGPINFTNEVTSDHRASHNNTASLLQATRFNSTSSKPSHLAAHQNNRAKANHSS